MTKAGFVDDDEKKAYESISRDVADAIPWLYSRDYWRARVRREIAESLRNKQRMQPWTQVADEIEVTMDDEALPVVPAEPAAMSKQKTDIRSAIAALEQAEELVVQFSENVPGYDHFLGRIIVYLFQAMECLGHESESMIVIKSEVNEALTQNVSPATDTDRATTAESANRPASSSDPESPDQA